MADRDTRTEAAARALGERFTLPPGRVEHAQAATALSAADADDRENGIVRVKLDDAGRVHACTVNGHDAQHWYDAFHAARGALAEAELRGYERSEREWRKVTGCIDRRAYMDRAREAVQP